MDTLVDLILFFEAKEKMNEIFFNRAFDEHIIHDNLIKFKIVMKKVSGKLMIINIFYWMWILKPQYISFHLVI